MPESDELPERFYLSQPCLAKPRIVGLPASSLFGNCCRACQQGPYLPSPVPQRAHTCDLLGYRKKPILPRAPPPPSTPRLVLRQIRWALQLRYRLTPYLYSLLWAATARDEPPLRPLFYDFEEDERCWAQDWDQMMLGPSLMAAPVVQPGATTVQVGGGLHNT